MPNTRRAEQPPELAGGEVEPPRCAADVGVKKAALDVPVAADFILKCHPFTQRMTRGQGAKAAIGAVVVALQGDGLRGVEACVIVDWHQA